MANYAITKFSVKGDYDTVLTAMETELETVVDTKTIHYINIISRGTEFVGVILYAT